MKRTIFVFSSGELHRKQNTIYFENSANKKRYLPVENIQEIFIFGEVTINKKLLEYLSQKEIILHFYNYFGYYVGSFYPRFHYNSGFMILKQAQIYLNEEKRVNLAKKFVEGAILNILKVITYYKNRGKELEEEIKNIENLLEKGGECKNTYELMAIEGNVREYYYNCFDKIIDNEEFCFKKRSRRPPQNRLNALISFGNSLLYPTILAEIYKTHLDPRIGFLHATNFRKFSLNLDVAEIFKPIIVDRIIFTLLNKKMLSTKDFSQDLGGVYLKEKGQKLFVEEFDKRLRTTISDRGLGRNISYRSLIRRELYKIEKDLMGDKEYKPFVARW
ncbi:MAG: subtype I-B CRISPR-associated endonuclease Cas1 [Candidatus Omnitrophica bacterium 4484_70.2]|nr:MAG: subtype I-B CRISPR-associated endonuclease Cas1 [Candidatus Omnitrophica bacterium 4484_70.2]